MANMFKGRGRRAAIVLYSPATSPRFAGELQKERGPGARLLEGKRTARGHSNALRLAASMYRVEQWADARVERVQGGEAGAHLQKGFQFD